MIDWVVTSNVMHVASHRFRRWHGNSTDADATTSRGDPRALPCTRAGLGAPEARSMKTRPAGAPSRDGLARQSVSETPVSDQTLPDWTTATLIRLGPYPPARPNLLFVIEMFCTRYWPLFPSTQNSV